MVHWETVGAHLDIVLFIVAIILDNARWLDVINSLIIVRSDQLMFPNLTLLILQSLVINPQCLLLCFWQS